MRQVEIFDTTLRDGLQVEGVSATVDDKLRIAEQLDLLGVHFIEGGWPGANPKDIEFFTRAQHELALTTLCGHLHAAESKIAGTSSDSEIRSRQITFSPPVTSETVTPARGRGHCPLGAPPSIGCYAPRRRA